MSDDATTKDKAVVRVTLDPTNPPPPSDWTEVDKLTEDQIHAAAMSDPDAQPATCEQLARARRVVRVKLIREKYGLSQEEFARRFGLKLEMVRGWEDRTLEPDAAAVTLLRVIWQEPEAVRRVVAAE
jgi:putative transcriptional regulator